MVHYRSPPPPPKLARGSFSLRLAANRARNITETSPRCTCCGASAKRARREQIKEEAMSRDRYNVNTPGICTTAFSSPRQERRSVHAHDTTPKPTTNYRGIAPPWLRERTSHTTKNKAPEFSCAENHHHSFVPSPGVSPPKKILQWEARHLVVLRNGVQQRVTLRLDVDRCHALYRVLDAHLVVNHLRLDSEGDEVRLEARVRKRVLVLAVLNSGRNQILRETREKKQHYVM